MIININLLVLYINAKLNKRLEFNFFNKKMQKSLIKSYNTLRRKADYTGELCAF